MARAYTDPCLDQGLLSLDPRFESRIFGQIVTPIGMLSWTTRSARAVRESMLGWARSGHPTTLPAAPALFR